MVVMIGTAGWTIPRKHAESFPGEGSHLQRYAQCLQAVEINSSFYRAHKPATYARWAASVPPHFRFAVKMPREITHTCKLVGVTQPLEKFLGEIRSLGDRLGPLLVQLPPSLAYEDSIATAFFQEVRSRFKGGLVCEPRHPSWFTAAVDKAFVRFRVARVAADPAPVPPAAQPGGWPGLVYRRLHGAPKIYYSAYSFENIDSIAAAMRAVLGAVHESWCIFDNTALGEATGNALSLSQKLSSQNQLPLWANPGVSRPHQSLFARRKLRIGKPN